MTLKAKVASCSTILSTVLCASWLLAGAIPVTLPAEAQAPPVSEEPVRVGKKVLESKLRYAPNPRYPEEALRAGVRGRVLIEVLIDPDGTVAQASIVDGHPIFNQAALDAVARWRFEPTTVQGRPVPLRGIVEVEFKTKEPEKAVPQSPGTPSGPWPIRVGGKVQEQKLIYRVDPEYPEPARRARLSGIVLLQVHIAAGGEVEEVKVLRGHPLLNPAAVDAVSQWIYEPTYLEGKPVPVIATVTVNFRVEGRDIQAILMNAGGDFFLRDGPEQGKIQPNDLVRHLRNFPGTVHLMNDTDVPLQLVQEAVDMLRAAGIENPIQVSEPYVLHRDKVYVTGKYAPWHGWEGVTEAVKRWTELRRVESENPAPTVLQIFVDLQGNVEVHHVGGPAISESLKAEIESHTFPFTLSRGSGPVPWSAFIELAP